MIFITKVCMPALSSKDGKFTGFQLVYIMPSAWPKVTLPGTISFPSMVYAVLARRSYDSLTWANIPVSVTVASISDLMLIMISVPAARLPMFLPPLVGLEAGLLLVSTKPNSSLPGWITHVEVSRFSASTVTRPLPANTASAMVTLICNTAVKPSFSKTTVLSEGSSASPSLSYV